jgi:hypothetical protein
MPESVDLKLTRRTVAYTESSSAKVLCSVEYRRGRASWPRQRRPSVVPKQLHEELKHSATDVDGVPGESSAVEVDAAEEPEHQEDNDNGAQDTAQTGSAVASIAVVATAAAEKEE